LSLTKTPMAEVTDSAVDCYGAHSRVMRLIDGNFLPSYSRHFGKSLLWSY